MKIASWNINSVRLREALVLEFLQDSQADVLALQETKSPVEKLPLENFANLGYHYSAALGFKGYNGVQILSKIPIVEEFPHDFCEKSDARHMAVRFENNVRLHNFYIPAGGDEPDPEINEKFAHKLQFLQEMKAYFRNNPPQKSVLVGDLNIAPLEDDVWSHKQLLKVVSHTPIEVENLKAVQEAGEWLDAVREFIPEGKLYSWWSYRGRDWEASDRGRRLDHIWLSKDWKNAITDIQHFKTYRAKERPSDHIPIMISLDLV